LSSLTLSIKLNFMNCLHPSHELTCFSQSCWPYLSTYTFVACWPHLLTCCVSLISLVNLSFDVMLTSHVILFICVMSTSLVNLFLCVMSTLLVDDVLLGSLIDSIESLKWNNERVRSRGHAPWLASLWG
jgi:hypothetical protein